MKPKVYALKNRQIIEIDNTLNREAIRKTAIFLTLFSSSVPKPPPLTQKITKPSCPAWGGGYN